MAPTHRVVVCGSLAHPERLWAAAEIERARRVVVSMPVRNRWRSEAEHAAAWRAAIDAADVVVVVPKPDGTLGEATTDEVEYAALVGKPVRLARPAVSPRCRWGRMLAPLCRRMAGV